MDRNSGFGKILPNDVNRRINRLLTGDVLLFAGEGVSRAIQVLTVSRWSHVGVVVKRGGRAFVWEATPDTSFDCELCSKAHGGVRLVPLEPRLARSGRVDCRQLVGIDRPTRNRLRQLTRDGLFQGKHYPDYYDRELALAVVDWDLPVFLNREDDEKFFCSELVARVYQSVGLFRPDPMYRSNEFTPRSFSEQNEKLPWIDPLPRKRLAPRLGPQFTLKE